jgi:hypothetical protein
VTGWFRPTQGRGLGAPASGGDGGDDELAHKDPLLASALPGTPPAGPRARSHSDRGCWRATRKGGRQGSPSRFLGLDIVRDHLREALRACGLPETLTMYQLGRHTYGAWHAIGRGSLASLREILGHSSVQVTERYGQLRPDLIRPADLLKLDVDLSRPRGEVVQMAAHRPRSVCRWQRPPAKPRSPPKTASQEVNN